MVLYPLPHPTSRIDKPSSSFWIGRFRFVVKTDRFEDRSSYTTQNRNEHSIDSQIQIFDYKTDMTNEIEIFPLNSPLKKRTPFPLQENLFKKIQIFKTLLTHTYFLLSMIVYRCVLVVVVVVD